MSDHPYHWRPLGYEVPQFREMAAAPPQQRLWLHLSLFGLTVLSTLAVGAHLASSYANRQPAFDLRHIWNPFTDLWGQPERLLNGFPFALTLLGILLAHEMGHYFACRYYGIAATYPYFVPTPTIFGTMGAFIRIRSPIVSRRALFDIGIAGPLVGFVVALPVLILGIAASQMVPAVQATGTVAFGNPPLVTLLEKLLHPSVAEQHLYLHPVARAAWVGLFATALNLLPIGQLDGGHILYALVGEKHRLYSRLFVLALIPLGYLYWSGWLLWSVLLLFLGTRHPAIFDPVPLDRRRRWLCAVALLVFLLCFTPSPVIAR